MTITKEYKNAFTEVYKILEILKDEDYEKIPKNLICIIEENMNKDYEYKINEDTDLKGQNMLPETKAILFNIYRDYLTETEKKNKIIQIQNNQRAKIEEEKRLIYNPDNLFKREEKNYFNNEINKSNTSLIEIKKTNFLNKIFRKIINIFKRR